MVRNKLFLLLFISVLLVSSTSAFNFDDVENYNQETKTYTINNCNVWIGTCLSVGEELLNAQLTTPLKVRVLEGEDTLVGEFNFKTSENFLDVFGELYLENLKGDGNFNSRGKQYKYKKYTEIRVDDFGVVCDETILGNGSKAFENCKTKEIGSHLKIQMDWTPITNPNNIFIPDTLYEIGIFIDVEVGDHGDWKPTFLGKVVDEWAEWTTADCMATGGDIKLDGDYCVHTFLTNSSLNITDTITNVSVLVVAGGGGGGYQQAGGGGAGGLIYNISYDISGNISVTVGDGGARGTSGVDGFNGTVSTFGLLQAIGGGGGGTGTSGSNGGSGGGAGLNNGAGGVATAGQGSNGGAVVAAAAGGGGGGATSAGSDTVGANAGDGGNGTSISINGTAVYYAGGGGGGSFGCPESAVGGLGGGGNGGCQSTEPTAGTDGLGGGGGGGDQGSGDWSGERGGSGVVIVRYLLSAVLTAELSSPVNNFNTTDITIDLSCNFSTNGDANISSVTIEVFDSTNSLDYTNTDTTPGDLIQSYNKTWTTTALTDDIYNWSCSGIGTGGLSDKTGNRTFAIDTTPPIINILSPPSIIESFIIGNNLSLNWTVSDTNLDSCWFDYNSINTTVTCADNNFSFTSVVDIQSLIFYANDSFNNLGSNSTSWSYSLIENNITFDNETNEGSSSVFSINVELNDSFSITEATLVYNNTNYTSSIVFSGGQYNISSTATAPLVSEDTNISFWFVINFDSTSYVSTVNNQSVLDLQFSSCGIISNDVLLNVSLVDEELRTPINGDIEIAANIISKSSGAIVETISDKFNNTQTGAICFSPPESYNLYFLDAEIKYSSPGYVAELYVIQKADLGDYPLNLTLFDLNSSASTKFLVKYQDDSLILVEGAVVQLLRKYIQNNTYEVVEAPLTSNAGTVVLHIDLDTNLYQAVVVKNGVILDTFTNLVFNCESELSGQCTQNLLGAIDPQNSVSLENLNDFSYVVSSVNNTVTTVFSIPSGTPGTVNIVLKQIDTFGTSSLCNQTIFSSAGSIDCTYNDTIGDSMVYLEISKNSLLEAQQSYFIEEAGAIDWLDNNFFIVLILLLSIVGIGVSSPEWMVIIGVFTIVISGGLWLLNGLNFVVGLSGLVWLIIVAGIIIFKLTQQEDR